MLDAFIIDQLKKKQEHEQEEWQPLPLTLEIPEREAPDDEEQPPRRQDNSKSRQVTFFF